VSRLHRFTRINRSVPVCVPLTIQDCSCLVAARSRVFHPSISCGFARPRPQVLLQALMGHHGLNLQTSYVFHITSLQLVSPICFAAVMLRPIPYLLWHHGLDQLHQCQSKSIYLKLVKTMCPQIHCLSTNFIMLYGLSESRQFS